MNNLQRYILWVYTFRTTTDHTATSWLTKTNIQVRMNRLNKETPLPNKTNDTTTKIHMFPIKKKY